MPRLKVTCICATLLSVGSLILASSAVAYKIPGVPKGQAGGPPTKPKGGGSTTKAGASKLGTALAGNTASELAKIGHFTVKIRVTGAGMLAGAAKSGSTALGSGSATTTTSGPVSLTLTFSSAGKAFLNAHAGKSVTIIVSLSFTPKKGKAKTSTVKIKTAA